MSRHQERATSFATDLGTFTRGVLNRQGEPPRFIKASVQFANAAFSIEGGTSVEGVSKVVNRTVGKMGLPEGEIDRARRTGITAFAAYWQSLTGALPQTIRDVNPEDIERILKARAEAAEEQRQRKAMMTQQNKKTSVSTPPIGTIRLTVDKTHDLSGFPNHIRGLHRNLLLKQRLGEERFSKLLDRIEDLVDGADLSESQLIQEGLNPKEVFDRARTALSNYYLIEGARGNVLGRSYTVEGFTSAKRPKLFRKKTTWYP